jgi:hypothetical protein
MSKRDDELVRSIDLMNGRIELVVDGVQPSRAEIVDRCDNVHEAWGVRTSECDGVTITLSFVAVCCEDPDHQDRRFEVVLDAATWRVWQQTIATALLRSDPLLGALNTRGTKVQPTSVP